MVLSVKGPPSRKLSRAHKKNRRWKAPDCLIPEAMVGLSIGGPPHLSLMSFDVEPSTTTKYRPCGSAGDGICTLLTPPEYSLVQRCGDDSNDGVALGPIVVDHLQPVIVGATRLIGAHQRGGGPAKRRQWHYIAPAAFLLTAGHRSGYKTRVAFFS